MTVLPVPACGSTARIFIPSWCSRTSRRVATRVRALVLRSCSLASTSASVARPTTTGNPSVSSPEYSDAHTTVAVTGPCSVGSSTWSPTSSVSPPGSA